MSNSSQIVKSKTIQNFTTIKNEILERIDLSWKAKGLYVYLMSLPPNWVIYRRDLKNRSSDGYESMNSGFNELIEAGYILMIEMKNEQGQFKGYNYIIYDEPIKPSQISNEEIEDEFNVIKLPEKKAH